MRRRPLLIPLAAVAVLALGAWSAWEPPAKQAQARTTHTVMVELSCGPGIDSVNPVELHVRRGDEIVWQLTPESDVERYTIKKKSFLGIGRWLFKTARIEGDKANPATGRDMKSDASGRYRYEVIGVCTGGPNAFIDPDIIIDLD